MSTLTITTIQTNLHWEDKSANLQGLEEKIDRIRENTELVILPEMFPTGFSMNVTALAERMDGPTVAWMKKIAVRRRIVLTGSLIAEENGHYFNRLIWMLPNGQLGYYDKRHRFAYGGEGEQFTAGNKRLIASVKGWKINLLVCYDLRFPIWSRQGLPPATPPAMSPSPGPHSGELPSAASLSAGSPGMPVVTPDRERPEYDLLLYVANWPERRNHAWKTLLQARAIENQSYAVGVNRVGKDGNNIYHSGDSMIVGPQGEVLYQAPAGEEAVFTHTLHKEKLDEVRDRFPFWKDADHFSIEP